MIGKLTGIVDSVDEDFLILDVGGVGYVVQCSAQTLRSLPTSGGLVSLAIETQMREDSIRLFGFLSSAERDWFRLLQTVQGVGAKVALALLGVLSASDLATAIAMQDRTAVARAPGVGPKLAARIVAELKDKAAIAATSDPIAARLAETAADSSAGRPAADAVSALVNLGYGRPQAAAAVAASLKALGDSAEASALIRRGLRELSQ